MKKFFAAYFELVKDMPSTQVMLSSAIACDVFFVVFSLAGFFVIGVTASFRTVPINILPPQAVHSEVAQFLLIWTGLAVGQYVGKRGTTKPEMFGLTQQTQGQAPVTEEVG